MKIAPYYQKLLEAGIQAAKSMEPITFVGMFDCGIDYLFSLSIPLFEAELEKQTVVRAVLSGLTTREEIESELSSKISRPSLFVLYLGQEGKTDRSIFQLLNHKRNLFGWQFSYVLFVSSRLMRLYDKDPLVEKVLKRNIVSVLPLSASDSVVVLHNYENRYNKKLNSRMQKTVIRLSGGNPGLIKALYLQAISTKNWHNADLRDERIYFRLKGIYEDIIGVNNDDYFFKKYGYDNIPVLNDFKKMYGAKQPKVSMQTIVDPMLLHFTKSERKVVEYFKSRVGQLVTKDDLAKVLWGEDWVDRYSDWAIDQLLSTLREKISKAKIDGKIVTKRGEGIVYVPGNR